MRTEELGRGKVSVIASLGCVNAIGIFGYDLGCFGGAIGR